MLNWLQGELSLEEISRLERTLHELRGEEVNREYWEEILQYPYDLSNEDSKRIQNIFYITIIEDV